MKRTLLLNANYEPLTFLSEKRVFKFLAKEKVEPLSYWDDWFTLNNEVNYFPSILRLKNQIKQSFTYPVFSKRNIVRRDDYTCQFCGVKLSENSVTIDHVIPKSKGGANSFTNCVTSCFDCNNRKSNLTLEQSGMKLLRKPEHLKYKRNIFETNISCWHEDWNFYYDKTKK